MGVLAATDWQPLAIIITFIGVVVTAGATIVKGKQEAGVADKANEALNTSNLVQTSFEGMKNQVEAWGRANERCEHRCDELAEDLEKARKGWETTRQDLRATKRKLGETELMLERTLREVAILKDKL